MILNLARMCYLAVSIDSAYTKILLSVQVSMQMADVSLFCKVVHNKICHNIVNIKIVKSWPVPTTAHICNMLYIT